MSFAVLHMKKIKTNGVKGIQFHNQRERESKTNPDIDTSKTHLNYDLCNPENIDFNKKVNEIIKNNVFTNRAIRKDAVVLCNFILTSDKAFFDNLTEQEEKQFFKKAYDFFIERYGHEKIVAAVVHRDEKTPHMHLSLVPVTEDNKLSAKRMFDRKELKSLQDDFPKYMTSSGFPLERGVDAEGENKHIETQRLKAMELDKIIKKKNEQIAQMQKYATDLQKHIQKLNFEVEEKEKYIKALIEEKNNLHYLLNTSKIDFQDLDNPKYGSGKIEAKKADLVGQKGNPESEPVEKTKKQSVKARLNDIKSNRSSTAWNKNSRDKKNFRNR